MAFFKKFKTTDPKNPILNAYNKLPTGEVVRRHYHFTGSVQGVGFRVEMWRRAMNMHLSGWVRNNFDGSVDAELEGPLPRIEMLIQQMKEIPRIRIETMEVSEMKAEGTQEFEMLNY
ncbi:acylphosphatase [uncultured Dubosiella sp.]|uniref:acylphosphatase n=1 Tax=uncultured Dubosiella sp. TaxID=1937011 RepID=UPI0025CC7E5A|nr:acylphosphatase [uncultured Dubosiella sp.]